MHAVNEDAHSPLGRSSRLFVVADGVGGGAVAALASRELVSKLHACLDAGPLEAPALSQALLDADAHVKRRAALETDAPAAATVAMCARQSASSWLIAWVGDCRIYRVRTHARRPAQLLTRDDTYRELNEPPPPGGSPDDPARMVGNGAVGRPNVRTVELRRGEMLALCSDGVHKHIDAAEVAQGLHAALPLAQRCGKLVELARARGSRDDATLLVVRREPRPIGYLVALAVVACALAALLTFLIERWQWATHQGGSAEVTQPAPGRAAP